MRSTVKSYGDPRIAGAVRVRAFMGGVLEPSEETEPVTATGDHAVIRGVAPPAQVSVAAPASLSGRGRGRITRSKIAPIPGLRLRRWLEIGITGSGSRLSRWGRPSGGQRDEARTGPGEGGHLAGNGPHALGDALPLR